MSYPASLVTPAAVARPTGPATAAGGSYSSVSMSHSFGMRGPSIEPPHRRSAAFPGQDGARPPGPDGFLVGSQGISPGPVSGERQDEQGSQHCAQLPRYAAKITPKRTRAPTPESSTGLDDRILPVRPGSYPVQFAEMGRSASNPSAPCSSSAILAPARLCRPCRIPDHELQAKHSHSNHPRRVPRCGRHLRRLRGCP